MYDVTVEENAIDIQVRGDLTGDDLDALTARMERLISEHGSIRMLFDARDFDGWDVEGLAKDLQFDVAHNHDVERVAVVGADAWKKAMTALMKAFAHADVRRFEPTEREAAWRWVREGYD